MVYNPAAAYGANKVNTASPAELTLMLYDGAIKFWNIAMAAALNGDIEKTDVNIKKARRIIVELKTTLDHKYSVAEDFDFIYDYIFDLMIASSMSKTQEDMEKVSVELHRIRDTWKQVMKLAKDPRL